MKFFGISKDEKNKKIVLFVCVQYSDAYAKELEELIDSKVKGKTIVAKPEKAKEETKDLVAALKASLQKTKKS